MHHAIHHLRERRPDLVAQASTPLEEWLAQFDGDGERLLALRLLEQVRLFTLSDVRQALQALHGKLASQPGFDAARTRYTSFAEGKSGGLVQYFYRTSNHLHHRLGVDWSDLVGPLASADDTPAADTLIIVDDTIGTGREAAWYFEQAAPALARWRRKCFLALVGFREGLEMLAQAAPDMEVYCAEVHEKLFDPRHTVFTETEKQDISAMLCRYGERVYPPSRYGPIATPYGYRDGQALLAYFYNTPSNTLPIFWSVENGWKPILQRFDSYNVPLSRP